MEDSDVSLFEVIHSGLMGKLIDYLVTNDMNLRDLRIRRFLHVFLQCPVSITYTSVFGQCSTLASAHRC